MYADATKLRDMPGYLIAEMPAHERPRERLMGAGPESLRDAELVAILLRTGQRGRSALSLAEDVLMAFDGDLLSLAAADLAELRRVRGVGHAKSVEICAAFELARRLSRAQRADRTQLTTPADVADLMRDTFRGKGKEEFHVLLLDTKHGLLRREVVTVGLVDRSQVHAREVFRAAIREGCSRIVLAHNHPSGDPTPSAQDVSCTKNLVAAGKIVGIDVMDHVVVGAATASRPRDYVSLREEGLL